MIPEEEIVKRIGLSKEETDSLVAKHSLYLKTLTPAQLQKVKDSLPTWDEAAKALGAGVTAQDLLDFVKRRGGEADINGALCICIPLPKPPRPQSESEPEPAQ
jgi:hypothetical protein